jgi:hypothetical protein
LVVMIARRLGGDILRMKSGVEVSIGKSYLFPNLRYLCDH